MKENIYIGLMSGTSVDGIDAAAVEITGDASHPKCKLLGFLNIPYEEWVRNRIFQLFDVQNATVDNVGEMNFLLGKVYGEAANRLIDTIDLDRERIVAIGSHGQTIYHSPNSEIPYTVQIGEGSVISQITGITCVSDFRTADIAAGGNGAPLVPFTEYAMFLNDEKGLLLQNIGGISNSTIIPKGAKQSEVFAFDNGPGNMIIDALTKHCFNKAMDEGGNIASKGKVNEELLNFLLQEPYYMQHPPKTTGRELFGKEYSEKIVQKINELHISECDAIATVTYLTARVIGDSYKNFVLPKVGVEEMIVGGGGSYNKTLFWHLKNEMGKYGVSVSAWEEKGHNSDAKEAMAFALLAYYTLKKLPNNLQTATGAKSPAVLGKISYSIK